VITPRYDLCALLANRAPVHAGFRGPVPDDLLNVSTNLAQAVTVFSSTAIVVLSPVPTGQNTNPGSGKLKSLVLLITLPCLWSRVLGLYSGDQ